MTVEIFIHSIENKNERACLIEKNSFFILNICILKAEYLFIKALPVTRLALLRGGMKTLVDVKLSLFRESLRVSSLALFVILTIKNGQF